MASTRERESRLQIRTLAIASLASLAAAVITSQIWTNGTPIAAALTPVIVAIVSEMLHRPTEAIARRVTTERTAILPEATGAGPPDAKQVEPTRVARDHEGEPSPVRVYRREPRRRWGRVHPRIVVLTAVLAFAVAAAALTLPELIAGQSLGKGDRSTSLFGGRKNRSEEPQPQEQQQAPEQTAPQEQPTQTTPQEPQQTTPEEQPTAPGQQPLTVPTVPQGGGADQP